MRCLSQYEPAACHLNSTGMINGWMDVIQGSIMSKSLKVFQRRFLLGLEFRSSKCGVFSVKGLGRTDVLKKGNICVILVHLQNIQIESGKKRTTEMVPLTGAMLGN